MRNASAASVTALACWVVLGLAGTPCRAEDAPRRAGQGNLLLAEKHGKLVGSFTYQLMVGTFFEWTTDPTAVPGILGELAKRTGVKAKVDFKAVAISDPQLLRNPVLLMTGNRAFFLSKKEQKNLLRYLKSGGFLYVDDCGGADWSLRKMIGQILPEAKLEPIKPGHAIFQRPYKLPGVPKVVDLYHGPAKMFGAKIDGRLALVYTYDTDLPCAWERYPDGSYVHVIAAKKREAAMRLGVNVLDFALRQHLGKVGVPGGLKAAVLPAPARLPAGAVRNYKMRRQLPCNYISAMAADDRYVWFGGFTFLPGEDEGLARYDKRRMRWQVFMDAEGVLSEEINCLVLDGGKVLVGADTWKWTRGLATFDPATKKWSTINSADGLPHDRVVAVAKDGNDLWVACRQGLAVLRGGRKPAEPVRSDVFPKGGGFMMGVMADDRYVWASHFTGVARLDKKTGRWEKVSKLTGLIPRHALGMARGGGAAWFLAQAGRAVRLVRFHARTGVFSEWPAARGINLFGAASLAADDKDVFVGTRDDGIYVFPIAGGRPTHHAMPDPLPKGRVAKILPDDDYVWASVQPYGGLWRLIRSRNVWRRTEHRRGTPASHVLSLGRVGARLYVGTLAAGPWALDLKKLQWQNLNIGLFKDGRRHEYRGRREPIHWDSIYSIAPVGRKVWMGTNHGLIVHDPAATPSGFEIIGPPGLVCRGLAAAGGLVWVASGEGDVLAYDPVKRRWRDDRKWSAAAAIRAMCAWEKAIYVGGEKGLVRKALGGGKPKAVTGAGAGIYGLWPTPGGLWIAAKDGLRLLKSPKARPALVPTGEAWGRVNCVVDVDGAVLVGTTRGLLVCEPGGKLRAFYNSASGLGADSIGAIAADGDRGRIWLGTLGAGMSRVSAAALRAPFSRTTRPADRTRGSGR